MTTGQHGSHSCEPSHRGRVPRRSTEHPASARALVASVTSILIAAFAVIGLTAMPAQADTTNPSVTMPDSIYQLVNPHTGANLLTPWIQEARAARTNHGFTIDLGTPFRASRQAKTGLSPIHRLYNAKSNDFAWAIGDSAGLVDLHTAGYADQGPNFYALATAEEARTQPVWTYRKGGKHRLTTSSETSGLLRDGWAPVEIAFHVPAPPIRADTITAPAAGSTQIGMARYPTPSNAIYVAPNGNDASPGTLKAPVRTIGRAIAIAPSFGTVILRAGSYRESVTIRTKPVTLQNFPGEAAWLDGSVQVTDWTTNSGRWTAPWATRFDPSPTYTKGAPDNTEPGWNFVNANHPMAAHPDQVFIDGAPQRQVASLAQLSPNTFYVDEKNAQLWLGSSPSGRTVQVSKLQKAITIQAAGSIVRGIGARYFAPSVWHMGSITIEAPHVRLENILVTHAATTGVSVLNSDVELNRVTVAHSGMLGLHSRFADRLRLISVHITTNNTEHFNRAPSAGGAKLAHSRGIIVKHSRFDNNDGTGLWEDLSCFDSLIFGNSFVDNEGHGIFLELSAKALVADNLVTRNKRFGIIVNNTSDVQIWNNTVAGNSRPLNIVQDTRRNNRPNDPATDPRIPWPDPDMPWTLGPVTIRNNILADVNSSANCLLCVEDYSNQSSAEQMRIDADSDLYHRRTNNSPKWLVVWAREKPFSDPHVFDTLDDARAAVGQERHGQELIGPPVLDDAGDLTSRAIDLIGSVAQPLPASIASRIGWEPGDRALGRRTQLSR